ncbi:MAG: copper resistance protein NlpE [Pseudomonadota bacterium]|nr:copper resistance protein NlpE [Pseudomonadota bacterium]
MTLPLHQLACIALACLALTACRPDQSAEPDEAPSTVSQALPEATVAADMPEFAPGNTATPDTGRFDARAFAGRFEGTLPCAACPRIDSILDLRADGTYVLNETFPDAMAKNGRSAGTWTAEQGGARLRLDPDSKERPDRLYEVASRDEIRQADTSDGLVPTTVSYSLRRVGAAQ